MDTQRLKYGKILKAEHDKRSGGGVGLLSMQV